MAGRPGDDTLTLPISIPIGEDGTVLLRPEGPIDAPRIPAWLHLTRPSTIGLERQDGGRLVIPGLTSAGDVTALTFVVGRRGMSIDAPVEIEFDEDTARALANALYLTLSRKITSFL